VARWLAEREQRIQALEAENHALRQQLERLRQGVGIALVIEGRVVPMAPSSAGVITSAPVPAVAPVPAHNATQPRPVPHPIPHPPLHATGMTGAQPAPHWPRREPSSPAWPPLAETPAHLPAVGSLTPTGPVSAIGQWTGGPSRAASMPGAQPAGRPEPRWFEDEAPAPATRDVRAHGEGNFLL
jgi:hypothetical protein